MPFKIQTAGAGENLTVRIENENTGTYIDVYALGAVLNQYAIRHNGEDFNCIDAYQKPEDVKTLMTQRFQGSKLSPFVCRLANGTFAFENVQYTVGKHFDGKSAIHGLVYDELFELTNESLLADRASIELTRKVNAENYGFPFHYTIKIVYTLNENGAVDVETIVTNDSNSVMPINDGWHPYFKLDEKVDNTLLKFRSKQMAIFDETLLPTGEFRDYKEFSEFKTIGATEFDNSFTIDDLDTPALELKSETQKLYLTVTPKKGYPILQVYIPPARNSIAVENLTGLPDSFNNHIGLLTLKPNESKHFATEYHLQRIG